MSLKFLVDDIIRKAPGLGIPEVLQKVDRLQKYIFSKENKFSMFLDPTTGMPPLLPTTAGVFEYDIPDVSKVINGTTYTLRAAHVKRVMIDATRSHEYDIQYIGAPFELTYLNPFSSQSTKQFFCEIPADSYDATETDRAKVVFRSDPTTIIDQYYTEIIIEPLTLSSVNIPLMLPQKWERALFDGVVGEIQDNGYGKDTRINRFYEYWLPQIWDEMDRGATSQKRNTPVFY
jgi:hypothetical protein